MLGPADGGVSPSEVDVRRDLPRLEDPADFAQGSQKCCDLEMPDTASREVSIRHGPRADTTNLEDLEVVDELPWGHCMRGTCAGQR